MTDPSTAGPSLVDVDASIVFRRPFLVVLVVTFVAGVIDAVGYRHLGVFTANQAGNLVVGWTLLVEDPAVAVLALASVLGCGLGVSAIVVMRHLVPWLAGPAGSRVLLVVAAVLIMVASGLGELLAPAAEAGTFVAAPLGSAAWWGSAAAITIAAFSVAILGMVFISGGGVRAPVLASTNAFVDAVRYSVASSVDRSQPTWPARARRAAAFPLAWSAGAAVATFAVGPATRLGVTGGAALVIVLLAVLARRV